MAHCQSREHALLVKRVMATHKQVQPGICSGPLHMQVSQTFPVATAALGGSGTFLVYSCIATAGAVWVFFALPETTGACSHIMRSRCSTK